MFCSEIAINFVFAIVVRAFARYTVFTTKGLEAGTMETQGMLMDVKRFAVHDGPGIRTTLFLKGCSLTCVWCHNPEGIGFGAQMAYYAHKCIGCGECVAACRAGAQRMEAGRHAYVRAACTACGACEPVCLGEAMKRFGRRVSLEEACAIALEDRMFYGDGGGVTLSGGEPLMQADFAAALLERLRKEGVHTAVDTCGNVDWAAFEKVLPHTDLFLYDVKHIDPQRHAALTGRSNEVILRNLRRLCETGKRVEIRMPLVPGANDDEATLRGIGALLGSLPIERMRVLPYHSMARSKYAALGMEDTLPRVESPTEAEVGRAVALLREYGVPAISGRE